MVQLMLATEMSDEGVVRLLFMPRSPGGLPSGLPNKGLKALLPTFPGVVQAINRDGDGTQSLNIGWHSVTVMREVRWTTDMLDSFSWLPESEMAELAKM
jgi:hypothetical protein